MSEELKNIQAQIEAVYLLSKAVNKERDDLLAQIDEGEEIIQRYVEENRLRQYRINELLPRVIQLDKLLGELQNRETMLIVEEQDL